MLTDIVNDQNVRQKVYADIYEAGNRFSGLVYCKTIEEFDVRYELSNRRGERMLH